LRATGFDDAALQKSIIGIASTQGENTPCSMRLAPQADRARLGIAAGGGVPVMFSTISLSDGTSMNHNGMKMSLVSRETIADSVELVVRGHAYDGLVAFAGCDKTLPAVMMAMVRVNVPAVFIYGGSALPGHVGRKPITILDTIEAVGRVQTGEMPMQELSAMERSYIPSAGSCPGQFTANTMAMVAETLGLSPLGSSMMPAVYSERLAIAARAGERVMEIVNQGGPLPRDLVTRKSLTWRGFIDVVVESGRTTGMIFFIMIGALTLANFINFTSMPDDLRSFVTNMGMGPIAVIIAICVIYVILGCVLESMSMILLTVPVFYSLVQSLGMDLIWFGIIVIVVTEISFITPPLGMNVFVIKGCCPMCRPARSSKGSPRLWWLMSSGWQSSLPSHPSACT
jgi:hypothetical protein